MTDGIPDDMIPDDDVRLGEEDRSIINGDEPDKPTMRIRKSGSTCLDCGAQDWNYMRVLQEPALGIDIRIWVRRCVSCRSIDYDAGYEDYEAALEIGMDELFLIDFHAFQDGDFTDPGDIE